MSHCSFPYPRVALLLGLALSVFGLSSGTVADAQAGGSYSFVSLDVPSATQTRPTDINDYGQVTGDYFEGRIRGFVYSNGTFTTLEVPGATETIPTGINNRGQVVGYYSDDVGGHGFVYSNGTFTTLDVPNTNFTYPDSINNSGQVTGRYIDGTGELGFIATPIFPIPIFPIPTLSAWAMLLLSLLLIGLVWQQQRRHE